LALLVFFAMTFSHSKTFADPYTFYDKALASSPSVMLIMN